MNTINDTTPTLQKSFRDLTNEGAIFFNNVISINGIDTAHVESSIFILKSLLLAGVREYTFGKSSKEHTGLIAKLVSAKNQLSLSEAQFFALHAEFYQLMVQSHKLPRVVDMLVREQQVIERALRLTRSKNIHYPLIMTILYRIVLKASVNHVAALEPDVNALAAAYNVAVQQ